MLGALFNHGTQGMNNAEWEMAHMGRPDPVMVCHKWYLIGQFIYCIVGIFAFIGIKRE